METPAIFQQLIEQARKNELVFPTHVHVTLKIQQMLDDPSCGIESAARIIMTEPVMATRVVAIANSVAYNRFGGNVTSVRTAITILGFKTLRSVVASVILRQIAQAVQQPQIREQMEALWRHSVHVAALAHFIASKITHIDPESALFAGIVHEVGGFYLLSCADRQPELLNDENWRYLTRPIPPITSAADDAPESLFHQLSRSVLKHLLVPRTVVGAIVASWHPEFAIPPETLSDTLTLARILADTPSPIADLTGGMVQRPIVADFLVGTTTFQQLLQEHQGEIRNLQAALLMAPSSAN